MTENRKNWLYPEASGLYFPHDGFVMRATDGKQYDIEEECELLNQLNDENEELKKRDDLVSSELRDEGSITLEKYTEIVDYLYKEWKKRRDNE